jgi:hypothetical protein
VSTKPGKPTLHRLGVGAPASQARRTIIRCKKRFLVRPSVREELLKLVDRLARVEIKHDKELERPRHGG